MRPRRFLLVTAALSSATFVAACKKEPLPGNPKGSVYDDAPPPPPPANPKGSAYDDGVSPPKPLVDTPDGGEVDGGPPAVKPTPDAGPVIPRMPANPKGSHYDDKKPPPKK